MRRSAYYSRNSSYSRSYRAEVAEFEGRMPLTRASQAVAALYDCPQSTAKAALRLLGTSEWHHVGKYAREVSYFDTQDARLGGAIAEITRCGGAKKFAARRESLRQSRTGVPVVRHNGGWHAANAWVQWVAAVEPTIPNDVTGDSIATHCYAAFP